MKSVSKILILLLTFYSSAALAQKSTTNQLIAYSRLITGGAQQVDEKGNAVENIRYQYQVFLCTVKKQMPTVKNLWIKGQPYKAQLIPVKSLPVTLNVEKKKIVLVKKTSMYVWQLLLTPDSLDNAAKANTNKLLLQNEVVCSLDGSTKNLVLKKITTLPDMMTE